MSTARAQTNLFIVGAAKCGTTSVAALLGVQADVFLPAMKEPSPFADGYDNRTRFPDPYLALYTAGADRRYRLDASTPHLTAPGAAAEIRRHFPAAKIIILLRDPVKRAYSLYNWMRREGYEPLPTFEAALEAEPQRRNTYHVGSPQYYRNYLYRESGLYSPQVTRYFDLFPATQVRVIILDAPGTTDADIIASLAEFLEIPIAASSLPRLNEASGVRSARLQFLLRHQFQSPGVVPRPWPGKGRLIRLLTRWNERAPVPPLRADTAASLRSFYREDILALARTLNTRLDHWL